MDEEDDRQGRRAATRDIDVEVKAILIAHRLGHPGYYLQLGTHVSELFEALDSVPRSDRRWRTPAPWVGRLLRRSHGRCRVGNSEVYAALPRQRSLDNAPVGLEWVGYNACLAHGRGRVLSA